MKNLMIDLETMGNSSNAAIVSIGACFSSLRPEKSEKNSPALFL